MSSEGGGRVWEGGGRVREGGGRVSEGGGRVREGGGRVREGGGRVREGGGRVREGGGLRYCISAQQRIQQYDMSAWHKHAYNTKNNVNFTISVSSI